MAASLVDHHCPLCNTLRETRMTHSREKGILKVRLEEYDIVTSMKEQMAKTYGQKNIPNGYFVCVDFKVITCYRL